MAYRNGNYSAFYVTEPFSENNLGAASTPDFVYYNMLRMWKGADTSFSFNDSHDKTYNVRDGSDWEKTLKPRCFSVQRITIKMDCQPTTSTALPKSGISFF